MIFKCNISCGCCFVRNLKGSLLGNRNDASHEGVYPKNDGCLAIVDIDASKGFINFCCGRGYSSKWLQLNSNMLDIFLAMVIFSYQN